MKKYLAIKAVVPVDDYQLVLTFSNGEKRIFDMKPYLNKGVFRQLRDVALFNTAHVSFDTVEWDNEADFDPEVLYEYGKKLGGKKYSVPLASSAVAEPRVKYKKK